MQLAQLITSASAISAPRGGAFPSAVVTATANRLGWAPSGEVRFVVP